MIRRLISIPVVVCSLALVLAGCTSKEAQPPQAPPGDTKPAAAATPPAPPAAAGGVAASAAKDAQKAADVAKGTAKEAAKAAAALACSKDGCTKAGLESVKLVHGGKTFNFCCTACQADYKKANNLE